MVRKEVKTLKQNGRGIKADQDHPDTDHKTGGLRVNVDFAAYLPYLEDEDISEDEKRAFLQALWGIITDFVALGFGVHPLQHIEDACGQVEKSPCSAPQAALDRVESKDTPFIETTAPEADSGAESADTGGAS